MLVRQNAHFSEVNGQRVEFENRFESQFKYWRDVTKDQIQKQWEYFANRGSAALTRLENRMRVQSNRIQSTVDIQHQYTKRRMKALRKKVARTKSVEPVLSNRMHRLAAQMDADMEIVEQLATTMDARVTQMTEERERRLR